MEHGMDSFVGLEEEKQILHLFMPEHLTKEGVRFVGGVLHLDDIKELIDAAISAKTFEEKVRISKELSRKVIDDYCLLIPYGSVSSQFFAVEKVRDTHLGWYHISTWTPEIAWIEK